MLRVGRTAYLNVEPFFHAFPWPLEAALPPRALGEALAHGRIDAGPLALADCHRLAADLTLLPFGVASPERAQSVLLFTDRALGDLGGARIAVTGETSTSVRLLRILLAFHEEVPPPMLVGLDAPAEATLLIGDAALRALREPSRHGSAAGRAIDLGREWTRWTGLPCVFAAWAVRRSASVSDRAALATVLETALDAGLGSLPVIARSRRDVGLAEAEVIAYLEHFTYRLGPEEEKAMAEFRRLLVLLEP